MHEIERFDIAERVEIAKARLHEKLEELGRRARHPRIARSPWTYALVGLAGFLIGGMLRRPRAVRALAPAPPSIARAVIREILITAAGTATRRYLGTVRAPLDGS